MVETSLSYAVIGFAVLVAFGLVYTAGWTTFESVKTATNDELASDKKQFSTAINVTQVTWDEGDPIIDGDERLIVEVNNTGSSTLSVNSTDLLIDGRYANYSDSNVTTTVDGVDTDVWSPRTTLRIEVDDAFVRSLFDIDLTADAEPDRIRFVTGDGIGASERVS